MKVLIQFYLKNVHQQSLKKYKKKAFRAIDLININNAVQMGETAGFRSSQSGHCFDIKRSAKATGQTTRGRGEHKLVKIIFSDEFIFETVGTIWGFERLEKIF